MRKCFLLQSSRIRFCPLVCTWHCVLLPFYNSREKFGTLISFLPWWLGLVFLHICPTCLECHRRLGWAIICLRTLFIFFLHFRILFLCQWWRSLIMKFQFFISIITSSSHEFLHWCKHHHVLSPLLLLLSPHLLMLHTSKNWIVILSMTISMSRSEVFH